MAEFHETRMGMRFYEAEVPRLIKLLESIAKSTEMLAKAVEGQVEHQDDPDDPVTITQYREEQEAREAEEENIAEARSIAKQNYESDDIEIDEAADVDFVFSGPENDLQVTGAWVAARVWVEFTANTGGK